MFRHYRVTFRELVRTGQARHTTSTHRLYIRPPHNRLPKNCNNNDFTPFYFKLENFNILKIFIIKNLLI